MTESSQTDTLREMIEEMEASIDSATDVVSAFTAEMTRTERAMLGAQSGAAKLSGAVDRGLRGAIDGMVFDGMRAADAFKQIRNSLIDAAYSAAIKPITSHFGGLIGGGIESLITGGLFANGAAFSQGKVMPFAKGGVVTGPTTFPMRGGTGLMGEAGPEAIMPLSRGPDGSLGVRAQGQGNVHVTMNISTPNAESFQRSQAQVAAEVSRAISRGQRNR